MKRENENEVFSLPPPHRLSFNSYLAEICIFSLECAVPLLASDVYQSACLFPPACHAH